MDAIYSLPIYGEKTETHHNQESPVLALRKKIEMAFHRSKFFLFFFTTGINKITVNNFDDVIICTFHLATKFGVGLLYTYNEVIIPGTTYQHQHRRLQIK